MSKMYRILRNGLFRIFTKMYRILNDRILTGACITQSIFPEHFYLIFKYFNLFSRFEQLFGILSIEDNDQKRYEIDDF